MALGTLVRLLGKMKIFVIHRSSSEKTARAILADVSRRLKLKFQVVLLRSTGNPAWRERARTEMYESELVLVFNPDDCALSDNARWEIETARELGRRICEYKESEKIADLVSTIRAAYEFEQEFAQNFRITPENSADALEIYQLMVQTSEELVRRRQVTNGFFIAIIGGLLTALGFLVAESIVARDDFWLLLFPITAGILLCLSWARLIKNYGSLNRAKFKVINTIEESLPIGPFSAEWVALGKGLRKEKYQSFTESEQKVPQLFVWLLVVLWLWVFVEFLGIDLRQIMRDLLEQVASHIVGSKT